MRSDNHVPTTEELVLNDGQFLADRYHLPVVWCDHQATRRQRLHGVNIPGNKKTFSSTHIVEVLTHVAQEGYDCAVFVCETPQGRHHACQIEFTPLPM